MSVKMEYVLKQQTPMIHFQHNESGACIRASELKPKLDRFLTNKGMMDEAPKEWYIGESEALDYKVKICAKGAYIKSKTIERDKELHHADRAERNEIKRRYKDRDINGMYFGNRVERKSRDYERKVEETYKETVFYEDEIDLTIICFIPELQRKIDENIEEFFLTENFGTRQSKGFGGFKIKKKGEEYKWDDVEDPLIYLRKSGYNFFYVSVEDLSYDKKLEVAKSIYAIMKGGINFTKIDPGKYQKGYIQRKYLDDLKKSGYGSEKAFIKSKILISAEDKSKYKYDRYEFVRAILGLTDHYEFRHDRNGTVYVVGNDIERYKSPVTIKITDQYVIFIFKDSYKQILGKSFYLLPSSLKEKYDEFDSNAEKDKFLSGKENQKYRIEVPASFDVNQFVRGFVDYFNTNVDHIKNLGREFGNVKKLERGTDVCVEKNM